MQSDEPEVHLLSAAGSASVVVSKFKHVLWKADGSVRILRVFTTRGCAHHPSALKAIVIKSIAGYSVCVLRTLSPVGRSWRRGDCSAIRLS